MDSPDEDASSCFQHSKPVESITTDGVLLCHDCIKGEHRKSERAPVFDVALHLQDELTAANKKFNVAAKELLRNDLSEVESQLSASVRQFFNELHEKLYDLEKKKTKEIELALNGIFGAVVSKPAHEFTPRHSRRAGAIGRERECARRAEGAHRQRRVRRSRNA